MRASIRLLAIVLLACSGCEQRLRPPPTRKGVIVARVRITDSELPFSHDLVLAIDEAFIMTLPNGKDLAVWCEKPPADLRTKSLWLGYGEGPFEMMEIVGDDEPGSYIQDGAATSWFGVDKEQYELSVGSCPVVLTKEGNPDNTIAVNISVGVAPAEKRR